jgi:sorting nexin-9/18/33
MSKAERLLSYSLLSLITSTPIASDPAPGTTSEEEGEIPSHSAEKAEDKKKGLVNKDGAWCWRENCSGLSPCYFTILYLNIDLPSMSECLKLTKAAQKTCETLQTVANLYDGHVRSFETEIICWNLRICSN